jgi:dephospho-CoA kinase
VNVIGLTGGIGMGKSTAADLLERRGLPVVDTDQLAREVVEPGQPAWQEIQKRFGAEVFDESGKLRRDELARRVFAEPALRHELEAIVHPRIRERWLAQVEQWRAQGRPHVVVVIPLLFEIKAEGQFDTIICVACTAVSQHQRLRARGWSAEQIEQRLGAQWPINKKMELSHFVVWTEASVNEHAEQLDRILKTLDAKAMDARVPTAQPISSSFSP